MNIYMDFYTAIIVFYSLWCPQVPVRDALPKWNVISAKHHVYAQTAMKVGLTLAQRRDDSTDVGQTLGQPTLLSGRALVIHPSLPYKSFDTYGPQKSSWCVLHNMFWKGLMSILLNEVYSNNFIQLLPMLLSFMPLIKNA